jgi:hypothetical protein
MDDDVKAMLETYEGAERELMADLLDMDEEDGLDCTSQDSSDK